MIQLPTNNKPLQMSYAMNKPNTKDNYNIEHGIFINDPASSNLSGSPNTNFLETLKKRISSYYDLSDAFDK